MFPRSIPLLEKSKYIIGDREKFYVCLKTIENLEQDDITSGTLAFAVDLELALEKRFPVTRITQVSLLHLSARLGNESACDYLRTKNVNLITLDSEKRTPFDYFQLSILEGLIKADAAERMKLSWKLIAQLPTPSLPPIVDPKVKTTFSSKQVTF